MEGEYYVVVKKYRDKYKLIVMEGARKGGNTKVHHASYDEKLENSLSRARQKVFEYAYCNDWDWYFTGTLDPKKYDRTDLPKFHKDLCRWLYDYRRKTGQKVSFLLIPEPHKDGCWHIHGLLSGVPLDRTEKFKPGTPLYGTNYLNWPDYAKKFGWVSLGKIDSLEAVSKYITEYISKSISALVKELNAHLYYCSRGLNTAEEVVKRVIYVPHGLTFSADYANEYCAVRWCDDELPINCILESDYGFQQLLSEFEEIEV